MTQPTILLMPEKTDIEFEQVSHAWISRGGEVKRLGKYWIKEEALETRNIALYGNQAFAFVLAQIYNATLLSPDDSLIARLDEKWTKRKITHIHLSQITETLFPIFIKSVIPKLFVAGIFQQHEDFLEKTKSLPGEEEILVSAIIYPIQAEARGYIMNGKIKDLALYEGAADLAQGHSFLSDFLSQNHHLFPSVVAIDIAFHPVNGWFILEFNACWGAGLNNCQAEKVIDCIINATLNKH